MEFAFHPISTFLPYNPSIYLTKHSDNLQKECLDTWPYAHIISAADLYNTPVDLIWVTSEIISQRQIKNITKALETATVLYYTGNTHFQIDPLLHSLSDAHFTLCTQWYNDQHETKAFFLNPKINDALIRGLSFDPSKYNMPILNSLPICLESFLTNLPTKSDLYSFGTIDCVYIINLDKRPEKLAISLEQLNPYNIHPYRFPAVNGWKLTTDEINQLGVKLRDNDVATTFIGAVFRNIENKEYTLNEFINKLDTTYFSSGITKGAIGCIISHLSILQDAYNAGYNIIWIMEDDIKIITDPQIIPSLLTELTNLDSNWDILFTDANSKNNLGDYVPCQALAMRPNAPIAPLSSYLNKSHLVNKNFSSIGMRYGTYSMIIHRSGMKKILDYYKKYAIFLPYDADYWLDTSLKMYHTNIDIVSTIPNAISDNGKPAYNKKIE